MKASKVWVLASLFLLGCGSEATSKTVLPKPENFIPFLKSSFKAASELVIPESASLPLISEQGNLYTFRPGKYTVQLASETENAEWLKASIYSREYQNVFTNFHFRMPKDVNYLSAPSVQVVAKELEQPVDVILTSHPYLGSTIFQMVFRQKGTTKILGTLHFEHNPSARSLFESNKDFLESYQQVRYLERGLVVKIDGALDGMAWLFDPVTGFVLNGVDALVNYGAMVYLAPWLYSRYLNIQWIIGDEVNDRSDRNNQVTHYNKWQKLIKNNPVIDYFSLTHGGDQYLKGSYLDGKKEHQLRLVHTAACESKSSMIFISQHNAAVAGGHYGTSASPLFDFAVIRNWVYGQSFEKSLLSAWRAGKAKLHTVGFLAFNTQWMKWVGLSDWRDEEHLLRESELMFSQTSEVPASNVYVSLSAVPKRLTSQTRYIQEFKISELE